MDLFKNLEEIKKKLRERNEWSPEEHLEQILKDPEKDREERRKDLLEIAKQHNLPVTEEDIKKWTGD